MLSVEQFAPVGDRKQPEFCLRNDITKKVKKKKDNTDLVGWIKRPKRDLTCLFVAMNL